MSLIQVQASTVTASHVSADVVVSDGKKSREYWLFVTGNYVTVIAKVSGYNPRRNMGKTFHTTEDMVKNYKRDGETLREVVASLNAMRLDVA